MGVDFSWCAALCKASGLRTRIVLVASYWNAVMTIASNNDATKSRQNCSLIIADYRKSSLPCQTWPALLREHACSITVYCECKSPGLSRTEAPMCFPWAVSASAYLGWLKSLLTDTASQWMKLYTENMTRLQLPASKRRVWYSEFHDIRVMDAFLGPQPILSVAV